MCFASLSHLILKDHSTGEETNRKVKAKVTLINGTTRVWTHPVNPWGHKLKLHTHSTSLPNRPSPLDLISPAWEPLQSFFTAAACFFLLHLLLVASVFSFRRAEGKRRGEFGFKKFIWSFLLSQWPVTHLNLSQSHVLHLGDLLWSLVAIYIRLYCLKAPSFKLQLCW